jgi:hypothetical protein
LPLTEKHYSQYQTLSIVVFSTTGWGFYNYILPTSIWGFSSRGGIFFIEDWVASSNIVPTAVPSFDGIPPPESSEVIILLFSISGWTLMMLDQAALSNTWCVLAAIREPNVKKHSPVLR